MLLTIYPYSVFGIMDFYSYFRKILIKSYG